MPSERFLDLGITFREHEPPAWGEDGKTKPGLDARDFGPLIGELQMKSCQSQHNSMMGTASINVNG